MIEVRDMRGRVTAEVEKSLADLIGKRAEWAGVDRSVFVRLILERWLADGCPAVGATDRVDLYGAEPEEVMVTLRRVLERLDEMEKGRGAVAPEVVGYRDGSEADHVFSGPCVDQVCFRAPKALKAVVEQRAASEGRAVSDVWRRLCEMAIQQDGGSK